MTFDVGTRVLILAGIWQDRETEIIKIIDRPDMDGIRQYDVACAPGRFYFPEELQEVIVSSPSEKASDA